MNPIGSIGTTLGTLPISPLPGSSMSGIGDVMGKTGQLGQAAPSQGFGQMLDQVLSSVNTTNARADEITQKVLLGDSGQLHQSVIAMQEASVAFSLMVQVRNKLVDSYQELMRMQV
jgi:flagellar hook-basal body complex protein FliE